MTQIRRTLFIATFLGSTLTLGGCAGYQPTDSQLGTGIGAVAGGLVGDAIFGSTAGTVGGAAAGALLGNHLGKELHDPR